MRRHQAWPISIVLCLAASLWRPTFAPAAEPPTPRSPATRPVNPAAGILATRPAAEVAREQQARKLRQLTRAGIDQIRTGKLDAAETSLTQALDLAPTHSTNLYNMACVKALKGKPDPAIDYLERAALQGFTDFIHISKDSDLNSLRDLPRFKRFLSRKDEFQRKAADRVVGWLKGQFGEGYLYEVDAKNKLIFATNTDAETLAAVKKWLVAQANSQWQEIFAAKPDQYISVVLPSAEDYKEIVSRPGVAGFYNHDLRILICQRLGQVMTHEFTHALHNADQDPIGQEHPIWLSEGLATLYESAQFEGEGEKRVLTPADNFRLPYMQMAARTNRLIPFDKLLKMEQKQFISNATLAYGQSGSILLYLRENKQLRAFYDAYKAGYDKDKTGRVAIEQVTGQPLAEFEKQWKQWMLARKPPVMFTGNDGPVLGVRFGDANDGMKIEEVVPKGPGDKAGLETGDVIVGLGEIDTRDQNSFMPLLAQHKAGDTVVVKVRRGEQYLSVPITLMRRTELPRPPAPATRPAPPKR